MEKITLKGEPFKGGANAKVTIVEYSDFQCPFCTRGYATIENEVLKTYGDKVKFYYKHFPLAFHKWAEPGAIGAECAKDQKAEAYWKLYAATVRAAAADHARERQGEVPRGPRGHRHRQEEVGRVLRRQEDRRPREGADGRGPVGRRLRHPGLHHQRPAGERRAAVRARSRPSSTTSSRPRSSPTRTRRGVSGAMPPRRPAPDALRLDHVDQLEVCVADQPDAGRVELELLALLERRRLLRLEARSRSCRPASSASP